MANIIYVTDKDGVRGIIKEPTQLRDAETGHVLVELENGQKVLIPHHLLMAQDDGNYLLVLSLAEIQQQTVVNANAEARFDLIAEELEVGKRTVESGHVRVRKVVNEREEVVDEPLMQEAVEVKRVEINRMVDKSGGIRYEGDTMIVPLYEEVLIVEKRLMLREELHITTTRTETHQPQSVTLRTEEVIVERDTD